MIAVIAVGCVHVHKPLIVKMNYLMIMHMILVGNKPVGETTKCIGMTSMDITIHRPCINLTGHG